MNLSIALLVTSSLYISLWSMNTKPDSALLDAARDGNRSLVQQFIRAHADLIIKNDDGCTPLILAALNENTQVVKDLIVAGSPLDVQDKNGRTALLNAFSGMHIETCIGAAEGLPVAVEKYVEIALDLIEAGSNLDLADIEGTTALKEAILSEQPALVQALIGAEAELDSTTTTGGSALDKATLFNHKNILRALIAAGAHFDTSTLHYEHYTEFKNTMQQLFECSCTPFTLTQYITQMTNKQHELAQLHRLNQLIKNGAPLDLYDPARNTVLHNALLHTNRVMATLIIYLMIKQNSAAAIMLKNKDRRTPLDIAVTKAPLYLVPAFFKATHLAITHL